MTGLDPAKHVILEIAIIITDDDLDTLAEFGPVVIHHDEAVLAEMVDVVAKMHETNGLTQAVIASTVTLEEATNQTLEFLKLHCPNQGEVPLCGNSIGTDRRFLIEYMPQVNDWLHYRSVDVSSIKELVKRWYPSIYSRIPEKPAEHRALEDVRDSIAELKFYRENVFIPING